MPKTAPSVHSEGPTLAMLLRSVKGGSVEVAAGEQAGQPGAQKVQTWVPFSFAKQRAISTTRVGALLSERLSHRGLPCGNPHSPHSAAAPLQRCGGCTTAGEAHPVA